MADINISRYSSAVVSDSGWPNVPIWIDDRDGLRPTAPAAELLGSVNAGSSVEATAPVSTCISVGGAFLVKTAPVASLSGEAGTAYFELLSLAKRVPVATVVATAGAVLDVKSCAGVLEGGSYANYAEFNKRAPVGKLVASDVGVGYMSLDKAAPILFLTAMAGTDFTLSLSKHGPTGFLAGVVIVNANGSLDQKVPVATIEYADATAYQEGSYVEETAPVGILSGSVSYADRFSDYILQYERWPSEV